MSPPLKDLIVKMLSVDPSVRPSAREVLNHHWFDEDREIISNLIAANDNLIKNRMLFVQEVDAINEEQKQVECRAAAFELGPVVY